MFKFRQFRVSLAHSNIFTLFWVVQELVELTLMKSIFSRMQIYGSY